MFPNTPRDPGAIPLPTGRFGLVYCDPPWRWQPWSWKTGAGRAAENHYGTMALDSIKALDVSSITAKDGVLIMWAIASMLPQALEVMVAWGFTYKTGAVWVKQSIGKGYWWRQQHELLLLGRRGRFRAPLPENRFPSVVYAPRPRRHSEKPEKVARMLEVMFPDQPRIELYARVRRPGWESWGDELPGQQPDLFTTRAGAESTGDPQTMEVSHADNV
jgi:N6-adenosine-specific RNA methylase IME4